MNAPLYYRTPVDFLPCCSVVYVVASTCAGRLDTSSATEQEEQIAKVAQSYGWKGTASEVHYNPLTKVYLCQRFGNDVRLKGACGGYSPDAYR